MRNGRRKGSKLIKLDPSLFSHQVFPPTPTTTISPLSPLDSFSHFQPGELLPPLPYNHHTSLSSPLSSFYTTLLCFLELHSCVFHPSLFPNVEKKKCPLLSSLSSWPVVFSAPMLRFPFRKEEEEEGGRLSNSAPDKRKKKGMKERRKKPYGRTDRPCCSLLLLCYQGHVVK